MEVNNFVLFINSSAAVVRRNKVECVAGHKEGAGNTITEDDVKR